MTASPGPEFAAILPVPDSVAPGAVFESVAGTAPTVRIVRSLLDALPDDAEVAVAVGERLVDGVRRLLADAGLVAVGVVSVDAPATRDRCLAAGLGQLVRSGARRVLVHDIRQPLIAFDVVERVTAQLANGDAVVLPVLPVTDSVKAVDDVGAVDATLDRATLRVVQYPRGFAVDGLASVVHHGGADGFDEAEVAIRSGMPITTVGGDAEAFLVDLPRDAAFLEAVIGSRVR